MMRLLTALQPEESVLTHYRERVMYLLAYVIALFITPFAVNNFIQGRYALGIGVMAVVVTFVANGVALHFKKKPPVPYVVLLLPIAVCVGFALMAQGIYGALWCYPAILFCFFILPQRIAIIVSSLLLMVATPMVHHYVDGGTAIRFAVSLGLNIVIVSIINGVVTNLQRELYEQATTDPLTGALNRRQMESLLEETIERRSRSGAPASVLLIDLDHFKAVNDQFGHNVGDEVLTGVVALLKKHARKLDRLFRTGGEEFLLLLPDTKSADAMTHAERLRILVNQTKLTDKCAVTVSIGVAECVPNQSVESWIKQADDALYFAKQDGRDRVVCETPPPVDFANPEVEIVGTDRRTRER